MASTRRRLPSGRSGASTADRRTDLTVPRSTVLPVEQEVIIVAFRKHTMLPLDDCPYACRPRFLSSHAHDPVAQRVPGWWNSTGATVGRGRRQGSSREPQAKATDGEAVGRRRSGVPRSAHGDGRADRRPAPPQMRGSWSEKCRRESQATACRERPPVQSVSSGMLQ